MHRALRQWSKKHSHLLVFFGALIVFLTFVVKEGLGDRWDKQASGIESAIERHDLNVQLNNLEMGVQGLTFKSLQEEMKDSDTEVFYGDEPDYERAQWRLQFDRQLLANLKDSLSQMALLSYSLPESEGIRKQLVEVDKTIETTSPRLNEIAGTLEMPNDVLSGTDHSRRLWEELASSRASGRERDVTTILGLAGIDMMKIDGSIIAQASALKARNERYSKIAWWTSAALFTIGWGLGLLGKLYGVDAGGGE